MARAASSVTREEKMLKALESFLRGGQPIMGITKQMIIDYFATKYPSESPMTLREAGETFVRGYRAGYFDVIKMPGL